MIKCRPNQEQKTWKHGLPSMKCQRHMTFLFCPLKVTSLSHVEAAEEELTWSSRTSAPAFPAAQLRERAPHPPPSGGIRALRRGCARRETAPCHAPPQVSPPELRKGRAHKNHSPALTSAQAGHRKPLPGSNKNAEQLKNFQMFCKRAG